MEVRETDNKFLNGIVLNGKFYEVVEWEGEPNLAKCGTCAFNRICELRPQGVLRTTERHILFFRTVE
uniref:Uncharacterized protein n=1 Tax=Dulem virus 40 TaxID=3145758 RepID=A0AAU8AW49_9CAUD